MPVPLWTVCVGLERHEGYQRDALLQAFSHVEPALDDERSPALEIRVRARSRDDAVRYVHEVLERQRIPLPAVTRVIDLRQEPPEARPLGQAAAPVSYVADTSANPPLRR